MNQDAPETIDDLQHEYDFRDAVQGKHFEAYRRGSNVVLLDPDVAKVFKDSRTVNNALRLLLELAKEQASP